MGEAVGEANLPKLSAYHIGPRMQSRLPGLGWTPPVDLTLDHGNWTRRWLPSEWDPASIAQLVVRTFTEVYGIEPWGLAVSRGGG